MSPRAAAVARGPVSVRPDSRRRLEERLCIRMPRAVALANRAVLYLPPRTRLRRAMIRRGVQTFLEAYNRKDFESTYSLFHPDAETVVPHQFVEVGFDRVTRGPDAPLVVQ